VRAALRGAAIVVVAIGAVPDAMHQRSRGCETSSNKSSGANKAAGMTTVLGRPTAASRAIPRASSGVRRRYRIRPGLSGRFVGGATAGTSDLFLNADRPELGDGTRSRRQSRVPLRSDSLGRSRSRASMERTTPQRIDDWEPGAKHIKMVS
jgi:hypothetical protein